MHSNILVNLLRKILELALNESPWMQIFPEFTKPLKNHRLHRQRFGVLPVIYPKKYVTLLAAPNARLIIIHYSLYHTIAFEILLSCIKAVS